MKVRCKRCGKVIKVVPSRVSDSCPECGCLLAVTTQPLSSIPAPTSQFSTPGKEGAPTENKFMRNVGCLIMGVLLFGVPMLIAAITKGDNTAYWVLTIGGLIALIPLGVWIERKTIGRK
jgi:phage FluMu protein Com